MSVSLPLMWNKRRAVREVDYLYFGRPCNQRWVIGG